MVDTINGPTDTYLDARNIKGAWEAGVYYVNRQKTDRIRTLAAWLMVPYLVWISFAGVLTWRIGQLNPDAETLVPPAHSTQIKL